MDLMSIRRGLLMMLVEGGTSDMELIKTYTVPESWETDAKGNPISMINTIFTNTEISNFDNNDYLIFIFENNTNNSNYKANWMLTNGRNAAYGAVFRGSNQYRSVANSTSFYASTGTVIKVFKGNINDIQ